MAPTEEMTGPVAPGDHTSTREVVRSAAREWKRGRERFGYTVEGLRTLVETGLASGPSPLLTMNDVKAEARRRHGRERRAP